MNEELEQIPKKQKKSKKSFTRESSTPDVADENIEVVTPVIVDRMEDLLAPKVDSIDELPVGKELGLIVPDDKMSHRRIPMQCNSCFIADSCPQFQEDSDCTIEWSRLFKGEFTPADLLQSSVAILDLQLMRINRAATFEALNQGILDPELSREIGRYFEMMKMFKDMAESPQPTISITAKGTATQRGGVLSQLLGLK